MFGIWLSHGVSKCFLIGLSPSGSILKLFGIKGLSYVLAKNRTSEIIASITDYSDTFKSIPGLPRILYLEQV